MCDSHKIMVIISKEHFDSIFVEFENSAKIKSNPEIYLVGLDTEYISRGNNSDSFSNCLVWVKKAESIATCKLQLATSTMCLVIDLCEFEGNLPENLIKILTSESWLKTGVGIAKDLTNLSYNFELGQCNGGIELEIFSYLCNNPFHGLADLYKNVTGELIDIKKKNKKAMVKDTYKIDWSKSLTVSQIEYASTDAIMSYIIGKALIDAILTNSVKLKTKNPPSTSTSTSTSTSSIRPALITTKFMKKNYISELQEYAHKMKKELPEYKSVEQNINLINDIQERFEVTCLFNNIKTTGYGNTKQMAKYAAAKLMLETIK
jgi:hypothetical protein